nr:gustatory receptor for sugar taste 43a-like [Vanessa tameamea]
MIMTLWTLGIFDIWFYNQWYTIRNYFHYTVITIQFMMEVQFFVIVISINSAFKLINKSLQELLMNHHFESETRDTRSEIFLKTSDLKIPIKSINAVIDLIGMKKQLYPDYKFMQRTVFAQKLRKITHCFVSTSEVLRKINRSENFVLVLHLVIFGLNLVVTVYNALRTLYDNDSTTYNFRKILQTVWFIYHLLNIIMFVEPCYRTQKEVSNVRFLVGRIMCYVTSETDPVRDEIDDFYKQLLLNNTSFSAMGICNLGRPLISAIIGSVTTIIVFLCQF